MPVQRRGTGELSSQSTTFMSLPLVAPMKDPSCRGPCTLVEVTDISSRVDAVSKHFLGALLDRVPSQTWVVEPPLKLKVEMSLSPSSTARSMVEAFDSKGNSGHFKVNLGPADECIFDLGCIATGCEGLPATVQTGPEVVKDADES